MLGLGFEALWVLCCYSERDETECLLGLPARADQLAIVEVSEAVGLQNDRRRRIGFEAYCVREVQQGCSSTVSVSSRLSKFLVCVDL